jgi:hypothetical protein
MYDYNNRDFKIQTVYGYIDRYEKKCYIEYRDGSVYCGYIDGFDKKPYLGMNLHDFRCLENKIEELNGIINEKNDEIRRIKRGRNILLRNYRKFVKILKGIGKE